MTLNFNQIRSGEPWGSGKKLGKGTTGDRDANVHKSYSPTNQWSGLFHFQKSSLFQNSLPLQRGRNGNLPSNVLNSKSWQCPFLKGVWVLVIDLWFQPLPHFPSPSFLHPQYFLSIVGYIRFFFVFTDIYGHVHSSSLGVSQWEPVRFKFLTIHGYFPRQRPGLKESLF